MLDDQRPIGTGFGPAATADDVLAGVDLTGRGFVVTGGHAGIGLEVTRALSFAGAAVTVLARDPARAHAAVDGLERVAVDRVDLVDPGTIEAFAAARNASGDPVHGLVNCAGVPTPPERTVDGRGFELQFATSHLGHFQLTLALAPALRAAGTARVVNVSSGAQRFGEIHWDDLQLEREYSPGAAYAQAKLANVLFAVELDRRWAADGVRAFAAHPGVVVGTGLNDASGPESQREMGLIDAEGRPIIDPERGKKTAQQGASTVVLGAASPLLDGLGGVYLLDNDVSPVDDAPRTLSADSVPAEVTSRALDPDAARRLWTVSEALLAG